MQSGSIVALKTPFTSRDLNLLHKAGITKYPAVGDPYECAFIRSPITEQGKSRGLECIVLVEFPEFEAKRIDLYAKFWRELLPPLEEPIVVEAPMETVEC